VVKNPASLQCKKCSGFIDCNEKCQFVTKLSLDKGRQWFNLNAPEKDSIGKDVKCSNRNSNGFCPLHLR
jgi:hypothetical protein